MSRFRLSFSLLSTTRSLSHFHKAVMASNVDDENGPLFLWREVHPTLGWLSQWYESPFHTGDRSVTYRTAEQYMMHQKAILFNDQETASEILTETNPEKTQALGRRVKNFDKTLWVNNRDRIVEEGSYHKFKHSLLETEDLKAKLLATGDRELVETSPVDRIWGVGFGEEDAEANREKWGLNLLGKALTRARQRIREEESKL